MVRRIAEEHERLVLHHGIVDFGHGKGLVQLLEVHRRVVAVALRTDLFDVGGRPARRPDPDLAHAVAIGVEESGDVGIGEIGELAHTVFVCRVLGHAHSLERRDAVRVHEHRTLRLDELLVQVGLVRQPHLGMDMHAARIHGFEDNGICTVLQLDVQAIVVLDDDLEHVGGGVDGRPVGDADHDVRRLHAACAEHGCRDGGGQSLDLLHGSFSFGLRVQVKWLSFSKSRPDSEASRRSRILGVLPTPRISETTVYGSVRARAGAVHCESHECQNHEYWQ